MQWFLFPLALTLTIAGCSSAPTTETPKPALLVATPTPQPSVPVHVTCIHDGLPEDERPHSFYVVPYGEKADAEDLYFVRGKAMLERSLSAVGYSKSSAKDPKALRIKFKWRTTDSFTPVKHDGRVRLEKDFHAKVSLQAVKANRKVLWQLTAQAKRANRDYEQTLPILFAAAVKHVGKECSKVVEEVVSPESDAVKAIRLDP